MTLRSKARLRYEDVRIEMVPHFWKIGLKVAWGVSLCDNGSSSWGKYAHHMPHTTSRVNENPVGWHFSAPFSSPDESPCAPTSALVVLRHKRDTDQWTLVSALPQQCKGKATKLKMMNNCEFRVRLRDFLLVIFGELPGLLNQCSTCQHYEHE